MGLPGILLIPDGKSVQIFGRTMLPSKRLSKKDGTMKNAGKRRKKRTQDAKSQVEWKNSSNLASARNQYWPLDCG